MPTTYSHYRYGQKVFALLPESIREDIEPYMDFYNIGVHGPDILFYYRAYRHNPINQYGVKVHHEPARVFFEKALKVYEKQHERPEAKAYLAGFMTHFILDSTCHPYINRRAKETGVSHTEIESDLDLMVMKDDGLMPLKVRKTRQVRPSLKAALIIAPYYDKTRLQVLGGLVGQKFIVDHIFRSRFGLKRTASALITRTMGLKARKGSVIKGLKEHFTKRRINPENLETLETLKEMMQGCEQEGADMVVHLCRTLDHQNDGFLQNRRLGRKFS